MVKLLLIFAFHNGEKLIAQQAENKIPAIRYESVIPGEEYAAGPVFRIFFGDHWRELWTTSIRVPVIDLQKFAGGLTPIKTGGGFQTKSLHFKGADGKFYKFRSINKDPQKVLPRDLRDTFAADIVQDQISTSHPISGKIVAPLLNAVGVLNATPSIIVLPDSPDLKEFRDDYKNLLGTIAENPKDETDPEMIFAGADKVVKLYKIFEKLDEDNDNQVNNAEFLKARLMDIFLGDWDRHFGQWKWARYKKGKKKIWQPIPRDRDQAFARYDGFFPWIATLAVGQIEGFDEDYNQMNDLTWAGRFLDRRILMSVNKTVWDSVTTFVQSRLTDELIEGAVKTIPESWFKKQGEFLINALKKRRDKLNEASLEFYKLISKYVQIKTSNKNEFASVKRLDDQRVHVAIYKRSKKTGNKKGKPFYDRVFHSDETADIRIYLQGGDDKAVVSGTVDESIEVKVIGGSGKDELIDSSLVEGYSLYVLPFSDAENKTFFYDDDDNTNFILNDGTTINRDKPKPLKKYVKGDRFNEKYEPPVRDWGHDWKPSIWFDLNRDDGLVLGGGPVLFRHGFRADPYVWRMSLKAGYATKTQKSRIEYDAKFTELIKNWLVSFNVGKNELAYSRFYGLGNERKLEYDPESNFYRIGAEFLHFGLSMQHDLNHNFNLEIKTSFRKTNELSGEKSILETDDFNGEEGTRQMSFALGLNYDSRDSENFAKDGFFIRTLASYAPDYVDNKNKFTKLKFDGRFYFTPENFPITFAQRVYAENIWGDYDIYDAAILGGTNILRGFSRERFSGDAAIMAGAEIKMPVAKLNIIIPGVLGFSAHAETGRVFYSKENSSDKWHPAAGSGVWVSYLQESLILNFTFSASKETKHIYLTTGFML
ncbi:MAG: BamA/TamA family outer membrane protein [Calditrichaeota bacterium]|nr:BamA/TamA family outer membrane protein [Calditrichota bacterium]